MGAVLETVTIICGIVDLVMFGLATFFAVMGTIKAMKQENKWVMVLCACMAFATLYYWFLVLLDICGIGGLLSNSLALSFWQMAFALTWWLIGYLYMAVAFKTENADGTLKILNLVNYVFCAVIIVCNLLGGILGIFALLDLIFFVVRWAAALGIVYALYKMKGKNYGEFMNEKKWKMHFFLLVVYFLCLAYITIARFITFGDVLLTIFVIVTTLFSIAYLGIWTVSYTHLRAHET